MSRIRTGVIAAVAICATSACSEFTGPSNDLALTTAFSSVLLGFDNVQSSFSGGPGGGLVAWGPGGRGHHGPGHNGLAGGGLGGPFAGGGFGPGFGGGRHGDPALGGDCTFDAASGRVVCAPVERHGLTIVRSAAYSDASGTAQSAFDSVTTNAINMRVAVSGTTERRGGATSTAEHASDRTVSGLAAGSTQRTINAQSGGMETTTGTRDDAAFTAVRAMGDTINNVVEAQANSHPHDDGERAG
jgi:hypothetical protein